MKAERIILWVAGLLLAVGFVVWGVGGAALLQGWGVWLWVGAFGVMALPLLLWLIDVLFGLVRR
jgi:hypothetical protein